MKSENDWKAKLRRDAERHGIAFSVHGHGMQAPGWPDLYFATAQWVGWAELKSENRETTTAQRIVGRRLQIFDKFVIVRSLDNWKRIRVSDADEKIHCESAHIDIGDWPSVSTLIKFFFNHIVRQT